MRIDRFTAKLQEGLQEAQTLASNLQHQELSPEHLFLALLRQQDGLVRPLLERLEGRPPSVEEQLGQGLASRPKISGGSQFMGSSLRTTLDDAEKEMSQLKDEFVSVEHFFLALFNSANPAAQILKKSGVTKDKLMKALVAIRGSQR